MTSQTKNDNEFYKAGFDCELNGPNLTNCNFRLFSTPERLKEWERGKTDAKFSKLEHLRISASKPEKRERKKKVKIVKRVKVKYR